MVSLLKDPLRCINPKDSKETHDYALKEVAADVMIEKRDAEVEAALINPSL
jgi:hypothetical protein